MRTKWFEFTIGLYVEAVTDEDAFRILAPVIEAANKIDPEGEAKVELEDEWMYGGKIRVQDWEPSDRQIYGQ